MDTSWKAKRIETPGRWPSGRRRSCGGRLGHDVGVGLFSCPAQFGAQALGRQETRIDSERLIELRTSSIEGKMPLSSSMFVMAA